MDGWDGFHRSKVLINSRFHLENKNIPKNIVFIGASDEIEFSNFSIPVCLHLTSPPGCSNQPFIRDLNSKQILFWNKVVLKSNQRQCIVNLAHCTDTDVIETKEEQSY